MGRKVRPLAQRDWDQLLVVASGYLSLTGGDLEAAMARAIASHAALIEAVKVGRIRAELPRGTVSLFVPPDGGLALAFDATPPAGATPSHADRYGDLGPPEITLEVHEPSSSYSAQQQIDAGPHEGEGWTEEHPKR